MQLTLKRSTSIRKMLHEWNIELPRSLDKLIAMSSGLIRLVAITIRLEAITSRSEAVAIGLEAIASIGLVLLRTSLRHLASRTALIADHLAPASPGSLSGASHRSRAPAHAFHPRIPGSLGPFTSLSSRAESERAERGILGKKRCAVCRARREDGQLERH